MSITLLQLNERLNGLANDLNTGQLGQCMTMLSTDALALIKKRVQGEGKGTDGQSFKPYSTKPMLVSRSGMLTSAYSKIAGSKAKRKQLKWVTVGGSGGLSGYLSVSSGKSGMTNKGKGTKLFELPGGYKQYRELAGRQTGFVDFTFTGRMWNNIKLVSDQGELDTGTAVIKATESIQQKKLSGLTEKRGEILGLSKPEIEILSKNFSTWVERIVAKNKLL